MPMPDTVDNLDVRPGVGQAMNLREVRQGSEV
jgi:hypothetical protein